jgi:hypothetical protein
LSTLVLYHSFLNIFLEYEKTGEEVSEEPDDEEVYYEERSFRRHPKRGQRYSFLCRRQRHRIRGIENIE